MVAFLTFIHILNCVGLIIVVLLQAGRGAGLAGVFGASAAGSQLFGGRGAGGFLGKLTAVMAIIFMISSISLTLAGSATIQPRSVVRDAAREAPVMPQGGMPGAGIPVGEPVPGTGVPGTAPGTAPVTPAPGGAAPEGGATPEGTAPPGGGH